MVAASESGAAVPTAVFRGAQGQPIQIELGRATLEQVQALVFRTQPGAEFVGMAAGVPSPIVPAATPTAPEATVTPTELSPAPASQPAVANTIASAIAESNWRGIVREVPAPQSMGGPDRKLYIPVDASGNDISIRGQTILGNTPAEAIELVQKNFKPSGARVAGQEAQPLGLTSKTGGDLANVTPSASEVKPMAPLKTEPAAKGGTTSAPEAQSLGGPPAAGRVTLPQAGSEVKPPAPRPMEPETIAPAGKKVDGGVSQATSATPPATSTQLGAPQRAGSQPTPDASEVKPADQFGKLPTLKEDAGGLTEGDPHGSVQRRARQRAQAEFDFIAEQIGEAQARSSEADTSFAGPVLRFFGQSLGLEKRIHSGLQHARLLAASISKDLIRFGAADVIGIPRQRISTPWKRWKLKCRW